MPITLPPAAPVITDPPATFDSKASAFVAYQSTLVTELNAALAAVNMTKWISGTTYAIGDVTWSPVTFYAYRRKTAGAGTTDPSADATNWISIASAASGANADITSMTALTAPTVAANPVRATDLQSQLVTAFTTGGTSTAFTLTPTPAITANAANQRFRVKFNAAAGTTPTLAVSGQAALNLKYKDSAGTKQAITATQVPINWASDVVNDGTDWVVENVAIIPGVTTNSSAPTGYIGEYIESTIAVGAAVSLTTGVVTNITSISLTAGDWDVSGVVIMDSGATTNVTRVAAGTSSTSATADVTKGYYSHVHSGYVPGSGQFRAMPLNTSRFSLASTTTIYLLALANFTVSTCSAYGTIIARRVR